MSHFIAHTPLTALRAVGAQGERSRARVCALVERHLSAKHAAILSNPVPLRDGSGIDWYQEEEIEPIALSKLSNEERSVVEEKLNSYLNDYLECAEQLGAASQNQSSAATTLEHATVFPGLEYVYAVRTEEGLEPLIVAWGFESRDVSTASKFNISTTGIKKAGRTRKTPAPQPTFAASSQSGTHREEYNSNYNDNAPEDSGYEETRTRKRYFAKHGGFVPFVRNNLLNILLWLLTILLFLLIVAFLLPACGLKTPFGTISFGLPGDHGCQLKKETELTIAVDDGRDLERELQVLQEEYRRRRLVCVAPTEPQEIEPIIPPDPVEEPPEQPQRVERRGEAQITLTWDTPDDLDLSVICPDQKVINYQSKKSGKLLCGGILDVDRNDKDTNIDPEPVENVTFPEGLVAPGEHGIFITNYRDRGDQSPVPYTLTIRQGEETITKRGTIGPAINGQRPVVRVDSIRKE